MVGLGFSGSVAGDFDLEEVVPADYTLRRIDAILDWSWLPSFAVTLAVS